MGQDQPRLYRRHRRLIIAILVIAAIAVAAIALGLPWLQLQAVLASRRGSDMAAQRAAMRPEFTRDVDQLAQATWYRIELTLAPDLAAAMGRAEVQYVNRTGAALGEVYFRLLPNAPRFGGRIDAGQVLADRHAALQAAGLDVPANLPVDRYELSQYEDIVYGKAPLFYDALYTAMGDEKFNAFLHAYLDAHRTGIARQADLEAAAAGQLDQEKVAELMAQWITGPAAGSERSPTLVNWPVFVTR